MAKMEAPSKRTIGDVKDEKDPVRVAREARWRVKNTGLGGLRWGGGDDLEWSLETTRDKIFEEIKALAGVTALNPQKMTLAERDARSKVYADMYANGCGSSDAAASAVNVEYYIDVQLWKDHGESAPLPFLIHSLLLTYHVSQSKALHTRSSAGSGQSSSSRMRGMPILSGRKPR